MTDDGFLVSISYQEKLSCVMHELEIAISDFEGVN